MNHVCVRVFVRGLKMAVGIPGVMTQLILHHFRNRQRVDLRWASTVNHTLSYVNVHYSLKHQGDQNG